MSQYTIMIRTLVEKYHLDIFDFDYPFYTDSPKWKQDFENLFINHYYHHEIGFETVERFQQRLQAKLNMIMPYYSQLYLTQWNITGKDMMLSKDLEEKTIRELLTDGTITENIDSTSTESNTGEATNQMTTTDESSQERNGESQSSSTGETTQNESRIEDGVSIVNLEEGNKTATSQNETSATSSADSHESVSSEGVSTSSTTSSTTHDLTGSQLTSKEGTSQTKTTETLTFISKGDVGIQTPAYAITEWRKVLININQMIINECEDLFMQIY